MKLNNDLKKDLIVGAGYIIAALVFSVIIYLISKYPILNGWRAFLGFAYVLFLPGYVLVRCFFNEVDIIEKAALSFGLSIALVILSVMISNMLLKIPITTLTNFLVILGVIIIILVVKFVFVKYRIGEKKVKKTKKK